jgi:hypothetical protein
VSNVTKSIDYRKRLKTLRPYVNFNYDLRKKLSSGAKRKINRYYNAYTRLTDKTRNATVYRPRRKDHLKKAQFKAGHNPALTEFKVAFLPSSPGETPHIRWSKTGDIIVSSDFVSEKYIPFNVHALIADPEKELKRAIKKLGNVQIYNFQAGDHEITSMSIVDAEAAVYAGMELINDDRYSSETHHFYGDWMHGIKGYNLKNQRSAVEYNIAKHEKKEKQKKEKSNIYFRKQRKIRYIQNRIEQALDALHAGEMKEFEKISKSLVILNNNLPLKDRVKIPWLKKSVSKRSKKQKFKIKRKLTEK